MTYYAARFRTPLFIDRALDQTLPMDLRDGAGAAAVVTEGTLSVLRPGGDAIVDEEDVDVSAAGVATYPLLATSVPITIDYAQNWSSVWLLTDSDGTVHRIVRDAHLVAGVLHPVIDASDLLRKHTDLLRQYTLPKLQIFVDEAWDTIQGRLLGDGRYPEMVLTAWSFAECHLAESLANAYADMATYTNGKGKYAHMAESYSKKFERLWGGLNWKTDEDQDGIDDGKTQAGEPVILLCAAPPVWRGY